MELRVQELILRTEGDFYGDPAWTSEAVGNVVKNCMEHTPDGGRIEIDAAETALYSEIVIKDNGTGSLRRIFRTSLSAFIMGKTPTARALA